MARCALYAVLLLFGATDATASSSTNEESDLRAQVLTLSRQTARAGRKTAALPLATHWRRQSAAE